MLQKAVLTCLSFIEVWRYHDWRRRGVWENEQENLKTGKAWSTANCTSAPSFAFLLELDTVMERFNWKSSLSESLRAHVILASYFTEISESKELLGIKRGLQTNRNCQICIVLKEVLARFGHATTRKCVETMRMLTKMSTNIQQRAKLKWKSYQFFYFPQLCLHFSCMALMHALLFMQYLVLRK